MRIVGLDPGSKQSALVLWDGSVEAAELAPNRNIAELVGEFARMSEEQDALVRPTHLAIELIRSSYGNPAGPELFDTAMWAGRFLGEWLARRPIESALLIPRLDIRVHLTGTPKSGDKEVRQALIERLGQAKTKGIASHKWAALAVAIVAADRVKCGMAGKEAELCI